MTAHAALDLPASASSARRATERDPSLDRFTAALARLSDLLAARTSGSSILERCTEIRHASREVAAALSSLSRPLARGPLTEALLTAADSLLAQTGTGWSEDEPADSIANKAASGWPGTVTNLFRGPAWQQDTSRPLADQPAWLWPTYARYLFASPTSFATAAEEIRWATHILAHLDPLVRMLEFNRGSASVKAVAHIVSTAADTWPVAGSAGQQRQLRQGVGRLRLLLAPRLAPFAAPANPPPAGSPLRVGLIYGSSASSDGYDAGRLKTLLDPERVELMPLAVDELPAEIGTQVENLREAQFDAVVFAGDLTRSNSALASLALYRVAPRQFATAHNPHTTGLAAIDIFLSDHLAAPDAHTEQLAVLPAALAFEISPELDDPASAPTRADLGLPAGARLLVATVHPAHLTPAITAGWQHILDEDPSARLILVPGAAGASVELLLADLERRFGERLLLAGATPLDPTALAGLLRVSDIYLPGGAPADHAHRALAQYLGLQVPEVPGRVDCLAFADALTDVLEAACRQPGQPLPAPLPARDAASRHVMGWDLLTAGRPDRATLYLLAAIEDPQAGPEIWHDLALALHASHQVPEAIQALETCVRVAPDRLDSWLLLADWAANYGHGELLQEIAGIAQTLAPADPRVTALAARIAA